MTLSSKPTPTPILVTDVCLQIRRLGGEVWHVSRSDHGTTIRASLDNHRVYFRAIVPPPSPRAIDIPLEGKLPSHVVKDMAEFARWLTTLSGKEVAHHE